MTQGEKLEYNKILASFLGYKYFEPNVMVDIGDYFEQYKSCNIFSKTPILLRVEIPDIEFGFPEERYFANVPNPDFGKTEGNKWRGDLHELSWASLNEYILDFDASKDWNILIKTKKQLLKHKDFNKENWHNDENGNIYATKFALGVTLDKPELAFKALAEYIKENKL